MIANTLNIKCLNCSKQLPLAEKITIKNSQSNEEEIICEDCLRERNIKEKKEIELLEKEIHQLEERVKTVESEANQIKCDTKLDENYASKEIELLKKKGMLENEQEKKITELKILAEQVKFLEKQEEEYWEKHYIYNRDLFDLEEKKSTQDVIIKNLENEINRLNSINVLNDVFYISAIDEVGTVNGLKLGKLKAEQYVNWDETNAALGQLVLFFAFLQEKFVGLKYKKVEGFEVNGSFSKIRGKTFEIFDSFELFGPPSNEIKFSQGIIILLSCINDVFDYFRESKELSNEFQKKNMHVELPHRINDSTIGEVSIKLENKDNKWDKWTEACKYMLTNIKNLIFMINVYDKFMEEKNSIF